MEAVTTIRQRSKPRLHKVTWWAIPEQDVKLCLWFHSHCFFPSGLCTSGGMNLSFMDISSGKNKDTSVLTKSLTPPGQVPVHDRWSHSLHIQGAHDKKETSPRSLVRKAERHSSSLSRAFVHCPSLSQRHHRGHCSDPKLRFIFSLMEVTKESFFCQIPAGPRK